MRVIRTLVLVALAGLALSTPPAFAEDERILSYDSLITVKEDGLLVVRETIKVRAEGRKIKRGIYRDIPTIYPGPFLTCKAITLRVLSMVRDGQPEPYRIEGKANGKRIYIGREDFFLKAGTYTYTLTYTLNRQLGFFEDHDELHFNAIGTGWDFSIEAGSATIVLPESVPRDKIELKAYVGLKGARGKSYTASINGAGRPTFVVTRPLAPGEGLTVVVGWPKGHVREP
ncbi:MAG: DUF2207 domain-containing protein, partial [Planctomycetota bacterium]